MPNENISLTDIEKGVIRNTIHTDPDSTYVLFNNILKDIEKEDSDLISYITKELSDWELITPWDDIERLEKGIYSPFQILFIREFNETKNEIKLEAPFIFSTISRIISNLQNSNREKSENTLLELYENNRKLLQSLFWIRETTEEREKPSLEVHLPLTDSDKNMPILPTQILAKVFGRGVAVTSGKGLLNGLDGYGYVKSIYDSHEGAPLTQLYSLLNDPYYNLPDTISLILNRNGHITIAEKGNSILEFYDGGWHLVDFSSWHQTIETIASYKFEDNLTKA